MLTSIHHRRLSHTSSTIPGRRQPPESIPPTHQKPSITTPPSSHISASGTGRRPPASIPQSNTASAPPFSSRTNTSATLTKSRRPPHAGDLQPHSSADAAQTPTPNSSSIDAGTLFPATLAAPTPTAPPCRTAL